MRSVSLMRLFCVAMVYSPLSLHAQQIYKCADEKGEFVYQQTPCASDATTAGVRSFQPAPATSTSYMPPSPPRTAYPPRRTATTQSSVGTVISGQGIAGKQRVDRSGVIVDQNGRRYQKSPGSNLLIDERSGRTCFLIGQTLQCD